MNRTLSEDYLNLLDSLRNALIRFTICSIRKILYVNREIDEVSIQSWCSDLGLTIEVVSAEEIDTQIELSIQTLGSNDYIQNRINSEKYP